MLDNGISGGKSKIWPSREINCRWVKNWRSYMICMYMILSVGFILWNNPVWISLKILFVSA